MIMMMKGWFRVEFNDLWCASKRAWRLNLREIFGQLQASGGCPVLEGYLEAHLHREYVSFPFKLKVRKMSFFFLSFIPIILRER